MQTLNGFGTMFCGCDDIRPDGSYITTEWIVFAWIPIIPVNSFRVIDGAKHGIPIIYYRREYGVIEKLPIQDRQVAKVYLTILAFIVVFALLYLWAETESFAIFFKNYGLAIFAVLLFGSIIWLAHFLKKRWVK